MCFVMMYVWGSGYGGGVPHICYIGNVVVVATKMYKFIRLRVGMCVSSRCALQCVCVYGGGDG